MREAGKSRADRDAESELIRRIALRDRDALGELYQAFHPRLFKFIFRLTRSYPAADELVNDVMLIVWQKADTFRGDAKASTWIFGIAYRVSMKRLSRRKPDRAGNDALLQDLVSESDRDIEAENWIRSSIEQLPDAQRAAVLLVFYLGLSYEETAAVVGCPVNTVKTRMYHARRKLKDILENAARPRRGE